MRINQLAEIVALLMESADEIKAKTNSDSQDYGQLLAYAEALSIIKDVCDEDDVKAVGLNFDIDKRYLQPLQSKIILPKTDGWVDIKQTERCMNQACGVRQV